MLDRRELEFNDDVVRLFEDKFLEGNYVDYHFYWDRVQTEDGWEYKHEQIENEFIMFLNAIYLLKHSLYSKEFNCVVGYNGK